MKFILIALLFLIACIQVSEEPSEFTQKLDDEIQGITQPIDDSPESIISSLITFGIIKEGEIKETKETETDWEVSLQDGTIFTIDKVTKLIHCIEKEEKSCTFGFIGNIMGGIVVDTDEFSCVPVSPTAAIDEKGMNCKNEIIEEYVRRKKIMLRK